MRRTAKESKLYSILTDIGHVLGGGLAGYISHINIYISVFYTLLYFIYQFLEHLEVRDDDFVGDLREFLIGFTAGLCIAFLRALHTKPLP
jgi:hypothetical protein